MNVIAAKWNKSNLRGLALSLGDQLCDTEVRTSHHQSDKCIKMSSAHDSGDSKKSTTEYEYDAKRRRNRRHGGKKRSMTKCVYVGGRKRDLEKIRSYFSDIGCKIWPKVIIFLFIKFIAKGSA